jgi:hypothetical protein
MKSTPNLSPSGLDAESSTSASVVLSWVLSLDGNEEPFYGSYIISPSFGSRCPFKVI